MLAGRPAFVGGSAVEILHATRYEQPPALTGSPAIAAADRVIRRAWRSAHPSGPHRLTRWPKSCARCAASPGTTPRSWRTRPHAAGRSAVSRAASDPEIDFLAFSLADAIATSLSSIRSLVLRSSAVAARFASETPDLKAIAAEADVDRVVMGTLLRAGDQLRVAAQLVDASNGTLLASQTVQSSMGDLFRLQDDIAQSVTEALALPLGADTPSTSPDARMTRCAYELYLRANELGATTTGCRGARDLYHARVSSSISRFAPAWARLGRCHRVIGKYIDGAPESNARAEDAFRRALSINPRLSDRAQVLRESRSRDRQSPRARMVRLLGEATRHGNDPELFAGLVHACRYCGLYDQSIAAHAEARRLDPNVPTGVEQTLLLQARSIGCSPRSRRPSSPAPTMGFASWRSGWRDVGTLP